MNKKGSIKKIVSNILFYAVAIFLVFYIVMSVMSPASLYETLGFKVSTVISESMVPTIDRGDLIIVRTADEEDIKEDDIIVFYNYLPTNNGGYQQAEVVHRYIDTGVDGNYITRGDNNEQIDIIRDANGNEVELTYDDVVGAYAFRIPYLGFIPMFLGSVLDPMLFALIVVNIIIIVLLVKVLMKKPEENEDNENDVA